LDLVLQVGIKIERECKHHNRKAVLCFCRIWKQYTQQVRLRKTAM